jgi:hypothetical protein
MFDLDKLTKLDPQAALDEALATAHLGQYIKGATYLAHDAPPAPGVPYIGIYDGNGGKLEVQVEPASPIVTIGVAIATKVL